MDGCEWLWMAVVYLSADWTARCDELEALVPLLPAAKLSPEATWVGFRAETTHFLKEWRCWSRAFMLDALKDLKWSQIVCTMCPRGWEIRIDVWQNARQSTSLTDRKVGARSPSRMLCWVVLHAQGALLFLVGFLRLFVSKLFKV